MSRIVHRPRSLSAVWILSRMGIFIPVILSSNLAVIHKYNLLLHTTRYWKSHFYFTPIVELNIPGGDLHHYRIANGLLVE